MEGCEVQYPELAQDETLCSDEGFGRKCVRHHQLLDLGIPRAECSKYEKISKAVQNTSFHSGTCAVCMKGRKCKLDLILAILLRVCIAVSKEPKEGASCR